MTKQIQELEARLGIQLFLREPGGIELTEATIVCLPHVKSLLEEAKSLEAQFAASQRTENSPIIIAATEFLTKRFLTKVIAGVKQEFPDAAISISDINPFETAAAVADGNADIGIARAPVSEPDLITKPFQQGGWLLILPKGHSLAEKNEINVAELGTYPLIIFARRLNADLYDQVTKKIETLAGNVDIAYHTQDPQTGMEMAENGIGLFLIASFAVGDVPDNVIARPVSDFGLDLTLQLVWRRDRMTPILRSLIDTMSQWHELAV